MPDGARADTSATAVRVEAQIRQLAAGFVVPDRAAASIEESLRTDSDWAFPMVPAQKQRPDEAAKAAAVELRQAKANAQRADSERDELEKQLTTTQAELYGALNRAATAERERDQHVREAELRKGELEVQTARIAQLEDDARLAGEQSQRLREQVERLQQSIEKRGPLQPVREGL